MTKKKFKSVLHKQAPAARITGTAREEFAAQVREQYDSGMTIRQIATTHGRSFGNIQKVLHESGAAIRTRGGAHA